MQNAEFGAMEDINKSWVRIIDFRGCKILLRRYNAKAVLVTGVTQTVSHIGTEDMDTWTLLRVFVGSLGFFEKMQFEVGFKVR